jgi:nucleotide-binding universal stress UspA family protein
MTKVIAALDNSLAARPVVTTAKALAGVLGAEVEALHVGENGDDVAKSAAAWAELELRTRSGPTVESLVEEGSREDVAALVIGARGTIAHAVGTTALAVAEKLGKPLVVVPPDAERPDQLRRIVVPLEGTLSASLAPRQVFELTEPTELDVVAVHVDEESSIPTFGDQPQHETREWAREFVARYCPRGVGDVRLETRVGRRDEEILRATAEVEGDLIALGWSQELALGRAPVVRAALERAHVPVLLVPVRVDEDAATASTEKEKPWSSWPSLPV